MVKTNGEPSHGLCGVVGSCSLEIGWSIPFTFVNARASTGDRPVSAFSVNSRSLNTLVNTKMAKILGKPVGQMGYGKSYHRHEGL